MADEQVTFSEDGLDYARLCIDLTVYWRGSAFDRADGILSFYKRGLKEIASKLRFHETGTMEGAKPLKKETLEMIPFWFQKAKRRQDIYMMTLESGAHANEPSDRAFHLVADEEEDEPLGAMKLDLPIPSVEKDPDRYVALVQELVRDLNFESGHAGYSLNWDPGGEMDVEVKQKMASIAARYWGIDLFNLDVTMVSMARTKPSGIKRVNWLTLLGTSLAKRVGTAGEIKRKLPKDCTVYSMPSGILIRAGEQPTTGDRNRNVDMASYRAVGRLLSPFRFVDHRAMFGGPDSTTEWLARFDG